MDGSERIVAVYISSLVFSQLLTPDAKDFPSLVTSKCIQGLPAGAELIEASYDQFTDCLRLIFRHDSFDPVRNPRKIPALQVIFQANYDSSRNNVVFSESKPDAKEEK